ncbi:MAG: M48 family metallopeptidase [Oscillospiraceae bacterium]|nr:M48 family metallopeptidase [Oscillospiraceae bacterium]
MDYEVIRSRSRHKYISTRVTPDGKVFIYVPYRTSQAEIDSVIERNREWIERKLSQAASVCASRESALSEPPSALPLMGKMLPVSHEMPYGLRDHKFCLPEVPLSELIGRLTVLYRDLAAPMLTARTYELAKEHGFTVTGVSIRTARSRWGSCSSKKKINLSWRVIAAPPSAIDYVIVHELCHTLHMDHSSRFWAEVARIMPDYERAEQALKDTEIILSGLGL